MWRPWYAALWAEAAVLTGHADAAARIERARLVTLDNPVAERGRRSRGGVGGGRPPASPPRRPAGAAGARYEWARTLIMIGGPRRAEGDAILAAMGATPMPWPVDGG